MQDRISLLLILYGLFCCVRKFNTQLFSLGAQHGSAALIEPLADEGIPIVHAALANDELVVLCNLILGQVRSEVAGNCAEQGVVGPLVPADAKI